MRYTWRMRLRYWWRRTRVPISVAALLMGAAWFIWPTPYREYRLGKRVVRVHRFTGKTEQLYVTGWRPIEARR